jgi:predicted heme/steroid binding protein
MITDDARLMRLTVYKVYTSLVWEVDVHSFTFKSGKDQHIKMASWQCAPQIFYKAYRLFSP